METYMCFCVNTGNIQYCSEQKLQGKMRHTFYAPVNCFQSLTDFFR